MNTKLFINKLLFHSLTVLINVTLLDYFHFMENYQLAVSDFKINDFCKHEMHTLKMY